MNNMFTYCRFIIKTDKSDKPLYISSLLNCDSSSVSKMERSVNTLFRNLCGGKPKFFHEVKGISLYTKVCVVKEFSNSGKIFFNNIVVNEGYVLNNVLQKNRTRILCSSNNVKA